MWKSPPNDTDTQNEQMLLGKVLLIDLLDTGLPQTFTLYKTQYMRIAIKQSAIIGIMPVYTMKYHSAIKNNAVLPFATMWIDLDGV